MKTFDMKLERCGHDGWYDAGTQEFKRISRWITVKHNYNPNKRNALWDYVMDEHGYKPYQKDFKKTSDDLYLDYFTFNGRNYAIEQFWALGNPFWSGLICSYEENGETHFLSGIDAEPLFDPLYIEMDEYGERVRIWKETS